MIIKYVGWLNNHEMWFSDGGYNLISCNKTITLDFIWGFLTGSTVYRRPQMSDIKKKLGVNITMGGREFNIPYVRKAAAFSTRTLRPKFKFNGTVVIFDEDGGIRGYDKGVISDTTNHMIEFTKTFYNLLPTNRCLTDMEYSTHMWFHDKRYDEILSLYKELVSHIDGISFVGERERVNAIYSICDQFLFNNGLETLPISYLSGTQKTSLYLIYVLLEFYSRKLKLKEITGENFEGNYLLFDIPGVLSDNLMRCISEKLGYTIIYSGEMG